MTPADERLEQLRARTRGAPSVVWLLCHYPDRPETEERIKGAACLSRELDAPVWVLAPGSAFHARRLDEDFKARLVGHGVAAERVQCSIDLGVDSCLDTVEELFHVVEQAERRGIRAVIAVSNSLQLAQVRGLWRAKPVEILFWPTPLRERAWWYVAARLVLIPFAWLGVGQGLPVLRLARYARSRWPRFPY